MKRRDFFTKMALAGAAVPVLRLPIHGRPAVEATPTLVTGVGEDYPELLRKVLAPLGGIGAFVKKGYKVVIKPNIGWDRNVEQAACTHPLVVRTLVELALAAGAAKVMVFDRTCNEERRCYQNSGIEPELKKIDDSRLVVEHIDERKFVPVEIRKGKKLSKWGFYKDVIDADCYINVPIAKHHGLSTLTLGLKNIMGVIGGNRSTIHFNMGDNLADLNSVLPAHLNVIDATRILLRNGPQGGRVSDVKVLHRLIASTDIVAADAYATTLFDLRPEQIEATRAAYAMGLGQMDLAKVKMVTV